MHELARTTDAEGYTHVLEEDDQGTVSWYSFHDENPDYANYIEISRELRPWFVEHVAVKEKEAV